MYMQTLYYIFTKSFDKYLGARTLPGSWEYSNE